MVAAFLNRIHLLSLSLVCKKCGNAAQDFLYKCILIQNKWSSRPISNLSLLLRTLSEKPDLTLKVKKLGVSPLIDEVDVAVAEQTDTTFCDSLAITQGLPVPGSSIYYEQKLLALLLLLPRLKALHLLRDEHFEEVYFGLRIGSSSFFTAFSESKVNLWESWQDPSKPVRSLSSIPALANINILRVSEGEFGLSLLTLPRLTVLRLGSHSIVQTPENRFLSTNITRLILDIDDYENLWRHAKHSKWRLLLALPQLQSLVLCSVWPTSDSYSAGLPLKWPSISSIMICPPKVEDLKLSYHDSRLGWSTRFEDAGHRYRRPMQKHQELVQYKLHHLEVMELALMGDAYFSKQSEAHPTRPELDIDVQGRKIVIGTTTKCVSLLSSLE